MLISCPKCNSVYNISDTRIPSDGKKFKCAECGEIWRVFPEDVKFMEPEDKTNIISSDTDKKIENDDINAIFSRLSKDTKKLFAGDTTANEKSPVDGILSYVRNFFNSYAIMAFLLLLSIILAILLIYNNRYDIVNEIPAMKKVYAKFNVESVYNGRDIMFKDVRLKEIGYDERYMVEISGRLYNKGNKPVNTVPVRATLLDNNGNEVSEIFEFLPAQVLNPKTSILFRITADNPPENVRKVRLSMEDIN